MFFVAFLCKPFSAQYCCFSSPDSFIYFFLAFIEILDLSLDCHIKFLRQVWGHCSFLQRVFESITGIFFVVEYLRIWYFCGNVRHWKQLHFFLFSSLFCCRLFDSQHGRTDSALINLINRKQYLSHYYIFGLMLTKILSEEYPKVYSLNAFKCYFVHLP